MAKWVITPVGKDRYDVLASGRRVRADLSLPEAARYINDHKAASEKVFVEEDDGYYNRLPDKELGRLND
jgi:hypothetical protein